MLILFFSAVVMLSMLDRALRIGRVELVRLRTRHKLLALRDRLQEAVVTGAVSPDSPEFGMCMDLLESVAKYIHGLHIYAIIGTSLVVESATDRKVQKLQANSRCKAVLDGFHKCMAEFYKEQHPIMYRLGCFAARVTRKPPVDAKLQELRAGFMVPSLKTLNESSGIFQLR